ncbi:MAG: Zn-ribbon domain-containing OB-fold protein [Candidatus Cloacimonetes bacterium]|nr:Zn-ribbon domain-containing OB-fold protein [Candidatus Cloacimonadota bacterium]
MPSPRYHREIPQRYRLEAEKCKKCGKILFPPRLICPECGSKNFEKVILPENGKIITFTIIRVAPQQFESEVPYAIAIVELENGVKITTQVVDCDPEKLEIGNSVKLVFRKIQEEGKTGIICYGYKAVLV